MLKCKGLGLAMGTRVVLSVQISFIFDSFQCFLGFKRGEQPVMKTRVRTRVLGSTTVLRTALLLSFTVQMMIRLQVGTRPPNQAKLIFIIPVPLIPVG